MTDYLLIFLTGFANGLGTITALEMFSYVKKRDLLKHPGNIIDELIRWRDDES